MRVGTLKKISSVVSGRPILGDIHGERTVLPTHRFVRRFSMELAPMTKPTDRGAIELANDLYTIDLFWARMHEAFGHVGAEYRRDEAYEDYCEVVELVIEMAIERRAA